MASDLSARPEKTAAEKAQKALEQKTTRAERKAQKEADAKQYGEESRQLFLTGVLPRLKALEPILGSAVVFDIGPQRFTASCRSTTKQGSLGLHFTMQPEADGSLILTLEVVQQGDRNPLSKRACFHVSNQPALCHWIDEHLNECVKIQRRLDQ